MHVSSRLFDVRLVRANHSPRTPQYHHLQHPRWKCGALRHAKPQVRGCLDAYRVIGAPRDLRVVRCEEIFCTARGVCGRVLVGISRHFKLRQRRRSASAPAPHSPLRRAPLSPSREARRRWLLQRPRTSFDQGSRSESRWPLPGVF